MSKPLYSTYKLSVIDIDISGEFDSISSLDISDITDIEDGVVYQGSWTFSDQDNYTAFMMLPDMITHIQSLQVVHNKSVKIRLRITVNKPEDYVLVSISVNSIIQDESVLSITDNSIYRFGMGIPDNKNLFRPYDNMQSAIDLQYMMVDAVNRIFYHNFVYYKVDSTKVNHTFKSITELSVSDVKYLKCLIPSNDFKDNAIVYAEYGIEYDETFELHITLEEFQAKFGSDAKPEAMDYFIIPELGRIYEITAAHGLKKFMHTITYYVLFCKKYKYRSKRDESAVENSSVFDIDTIRDFNVDLRQNVQDTDGKSVYDSNNERIVTDAYEESINAMSEHMYYDLRMHDNFRSWIHKNIVHIRSPFSSGTIKISTAQYNIAKTVSEPYVSEIALLYRNRLNSNEPNRSIQLWFNWISKKSANLLDFDKFRISCNYNAASDKIELKVYFDPNGENELLINTEIQSSVWYNLILNVNLQLKTVQLEIKERVNVSTIGKPSIKQYIMLPAIITSDVDLYDSGQTKMLSGHYFMTNLRVYNKLIDDVQALTNAIIAKADTKNSVIIDNCPLWEQIIN